jgi:pimeloyl-ACP methyl ester carboxylesterase
MPEITRDGVRIHFEDEGSGPAVLLIHGHTFDRRVWDPVVPALLAAKLRIVRPDLRGHGLSDRPDSGYHPSHHAADMAAVLGDCGVDRVVVGGYSVGGAIALEMVLTLPALVRGLVLLSPVMPDRPFEPAFMDNLREVARVTRAEGIAAAMEGPWAASPLFAHSFTKPGLRERVLDITRDFPGAEYLATARDRVERAWTVPDRLAEIEVPTAVLVGERELPGFRAYAEEAAAGIPEARLEVLDDCGHLLPFEEPDRVAAAIIDVASRSGGARL